MTFLPLDPFTLVTWPKRLRATAKRWGTTCLRPLRPSRLQRRRAGPHNLLILAIDTLRYDHLSLAGYRRNTTPVLDRLAEAGTLFGDVMAPAPWTLPSFASSLTGMMPCLHGANIGGATRNLDQRPPGRLDRKARTLAQQLEDHGYRTAAFYSNPFFAFGMAETFQRSSYANLPAGELAFSALEWIRRHADEPFFCFVLFNDPHEPTTPPKRWLRPLLGELAGRGVTADRRQLRALARWGEQSGGGVSLGHQTIPLSERARQALDLKIALYDATIGYVDATIGRMLDRLRGWGLQEQTLVTVYSDHGEEFLDHLQQARLWDHDPRPIRAIGHGHSQFQELLHVPWLACGPGVPERARIDVPVSLCDVAPTLLSWLELDPLAPPASVTPGLVGRSLASLAQAPAGAPQSQAADAATTDPAPRLLLAEDIAYGPDLVAIRQGHWKLIATRQAEPLALYHLQKDPLEKSDRRRSRPEVAAALTEAVAAWRRQRPADDDESPGGADWRDMSATVRKRLQELGYTD